MSTKDKFQSFIKSESIFDNDKISFKINDGNGGQCEVKLTNHTLDQNRYMGDNLHQFDKYASSGEWYNGDTIHIAPYNPDQLYPQQPPYGIGTGISTTGWGKIAIKDELDKYVKSEDLEKELEKYTKILKKSVPNKVDKDLIDTKIPYNVKKDNMGDLYYIFAIAGYSIGQIKVTQSKDGLLLKLFSKDDSDDLIGDEYEFLCRGIKDGDQEVPIFIDSDDYATNSPRIRLENGLLTIKIHKRTKVNKVEFPIEEIVEEMDTKLELI